MTIPNPLMQTELTNDAAPPTAHAKIAPASIIANQPLVDVRNAEVAYQLFDR